MEQQGLTVNKLNRKLEKCINTCKSQASKATKASKKLVMNIKSKRGSVEQNEYYEDNVSWGSDFDDNENDKDYESEHEYGRLDFSTSHPVGNNGVQCEQSKSGSYDLMRRKNTGSENKEFYEQVCDYNSGIRGTAFKPINDDEIIPNDHNDQNISFGKSQSQLASQELLPTTCNSSDIKENNKENETTSSTKEVNGEKQKTKENEPSDINGAKDCLPNRPNTLNMPKPPTTEKPPIKNKPTIIPRKKLPNGGTKSPNCSSIKRPPSEPPPPPLPKSPPPTSPSIMPPELQNITPDDMYERPIVQPDDEYLSPLPSTHVNLERKHSFSTLSTLSSSIRDFDSLNGSCSPLSLASSSNTSRHIDGDAYDGEDPMLGVDRDGETSYDDNYEVVQDSPLDMKSSTLERAISAAGRPLLPIKKESTNNANNNNKSKRTGLNFTRIMNKDKHKDKDKDKGIDQSRNSSVKEGMQRSLSQSNSTSELNRQACQPDNLPMTNNHSSQHTARPLPPLPRPGISATNSVPPCAPKVLSSVQSQSPRSRSESDSMRQCSWYKDIERYDAEELLKSQCENGVYLVRDSKRGGIDNPFTLTIFNDNRVFHLNIRLRADGRYALGKEKAKEKSFNTVEELISHHHNESILLTSKGASAGKTKLRYSPNTQY